MPTKSSNGTRVFFVQGLLDMFIWVLVPCWSHFDTETTQMQRCIDIDCFSERKCSFIKFGPVTLYSMRRFVHSSSGNNSIVDITKILGLESLLWCQNVCWDVLVRLRLLLTIFMHIEFHPIWLYLPVLVQTNLQSMEDIKVLNRILWDTCFHFWWEGKCVYIFPNLDQMWRWSFNDAFNSHLHDYV